MVVDVKQCDVVVVVCQHLILGPNLFAFIFVL